MQGKAPAELLKAQTLANSLDTAIKVPFLPIRIGFDAVVGLIPGGGDLLMFLVALRIIWLGKKLGLPRALCFQMIKNSVLDLLFGFIPVIGDIVDVFFKSNQKNVRILERWWISQNKADVDRMTQEKIKAWEANLTNE